MHTVNRSFQTHNTTTRTQTYTTQNQNGRPLNPQQPPNGGVYRQAPNQNRYAQNPNTQYARPNPNGQPYAPQYRPVPQQSKPAAPVPYVPGKTASVLCRTFGLIGLIPSATVTAILGLVDISSFSLNALLHHGVVMLPITCAFALLTGFGFGKANQIKRSQTYRKLFGNSKMMPLDQLSQLTGRSDKYLVKDLRKMVRQGLLSNIYFDTQQSCVILDDDTYHQYQVLENRRKHLESTQTDATRLASGGEQPMSGLRAEGQKYIRQIRAANDALPGKEISEKLFRLEAITVQIYEHIDKHPEKLDQVRKFMDYYMPTTTKLVNAYQEFEAQPIQGENILKAKREIENMLQTICKAFERMLDGLFAEHAMDISSDISVMETMFKQDGLTEDDISSSK
jgi:hypothetical protein